MAAEGADDPDFVADHILKWRAVLKQKMALVCINVNRNELAGLSLNCVFTRNETFFDDIIKVVSFEHQQKNEMK